MKDIGLATILKRRHRLCGSGHQPDGARQIIVAQQRFMQHGGDRGGIEIIGANGVEAVVACDLRQAQDFFCVRNNGLNSKNAWRHEQKQHRRENRQGISSHFS
ncbi:hypothetical protein [Herbaspirillum lusitanum]|uniref:hypothetical protein n=1 Tax=Herbaspirillum lusitanum TaxID=213312 RepID=UPI0038B71045